MARATGRSAEPPSTVTFPARAWTAVAVFALLMLALLGLMLASIENQRHRVVDQDRRITQLQAQAQPLLRLLDPLAVQATQALGPLRSTGRQARSLIAAARPALDKASALADQATPLAARLNATDAAGSLQAIGALVRALPAGQAALLIGQLSRLMAQVQGTGLVGQAGRAAADVPSLVRLQRRLLRIQLASLGAQRQTLATQLDTLQIQRQTLAAQLHALDFAQQTLNHVESLDRKTGGSMPALPARG